MIIMYMRGIAIYSLPRRGITHAMKAFFLGWAATCTMTECCTQSKVWPPAPACYALLSVMRWLREKEACW